MIFSIGNHVELIVKGLKTQTRRSSDRYQVGHFYSIQPQRTAKGIPEGKIKIVDKAIECYPYSISYEDAKAEGGYTPIQFEALYAKIHPNWNTRVAYLFRFVPREVDESE